MNASADMSPFMKGPRWPSRRLSALLLLLGATVGTACSGNITPGRPGGSDPSHPSDPGKPGSNNPGSPSNPSNPSNPGNPGMTDPVKPAVPAPAGTTASAAPLRRLNADQYKNTVQDLLGNAASDLVIDGALPPDDSIGDERFVSNVLRPVQSVDVDHYANLAEGIARKVVTSLSTLLGCDPAGNGEGACIDGFIERFGKRAYRRPLSQLEKDKAKSLYMAGRTGADPANGVRLVVQAILQAPSFLYLVEPAAGETGKTVAVDSWSLASRMSYFLLNSMPDDELFGAAESNALADADEVGKQATRLMGTQRFRDMVANFHAQWLEIGELKAAEKDPMLFPTFNDALRAAMLEEPRRFVDYVMHDGGGRLETLLTAPYSVLTGPLYDLYGVPKPAGAAATSWQKADLDPKQRAGLFTQAGILASLAKPDRTSFIRRGKLIRAGLLCTPIPDPPPGVDASESMVPATADARARSDAHQAKPECAVCHKLFDPLGFAFENYDAIGKFRAADNGKTIDAHADVTETNALNGTVRDAVDLLTKLSTSDQVRACVAKQWMRFALGRDDSDDDAASLGQAVDGFKKGEWKISDLLLAVARSDSFRYQKVKP